MSVSSAAESYQRLANPRADESVLRVRPPHFMSLLAAGEKRGHKVPNSVALVKYICEGCNDNTRGQEKIRYTDEILALLKLLAKI